MNILKVDTYVDINVDSPPSTTSTTSSPSPLAQSDTLPFSLSRQSSQTNTLDTASTTSLSTPTVKFAPLPAIGPRKRRSNQPLGMAARAQLVGRKRDKQGQNGELVLSTNPMWTSAELEEQRSRIEVMAARHAEFQARENAQEVSRQCDEVDATHPDRSDVSDFGVEDPILVIGKIVKVAGKTLWNRMSGSKSEASLAISQERRRRDLSPLPILIKSVAPEPVPPARAANANAWKEPTQQPETQYQNDVTEQNDQPAGDVDEWQSETISEPVYSSDASDEEVFPGCDFLGST
jgi:hypothetical protein